MDEFKPDFWYYATTWGFLTLLAGAQGWLTGESVIQVYEWVHYLSNSP